MNAKEFLKEMAQLENAIKSKQFMAQRYRELEQGLQSPRYSDIPKSPNRRLQPMADALNKALEIEDDITLLEQMLIEKRTTEMNIIYEMTNNEYQVVLIKRSFENKSWGQIMSAIYYSKSGIYKLHNQALDEFTRLLNDSRPE